MSNLIARVLVAAVAVPAIIALLYCVPPPGFYILVLVSTIITSAELFKLVAPQQRIAQATGAAMTAAVSLGMYGGVRDVRVLGTMLVLVPLFGILLPLARPSDVQNAATRAATFAFGPLYIGVPLSFLAILQRDYHPGWTLCALGFAWFGDTFGYLTGIRWGRHKLYPSVSPKKTVEGAIGGLLGSVAGGIWASQHILRGHLPLAHAIVLAVIAGVLGQLGDLGESLIKRSTGVKDSGGILPGHGGLLDRLDATLFTTTSVYLYVLWTH